MEKVTVYSVEYVTDGVLSFGDYGGAGAVGVANVQYVLEQAKDSVMGISFNDIDATPSTYYVGEVQEAFEKGERPLVLHATGGYRSESVYILASSDLAEEIETALADYPILDDEAVTEIELKWEEEAWDSYVKSDLESAIGYGNTKSDAWDSAYEALPDEELFWIYCEARDAHDAYPVSEYSGVYVDVDKIAATYEEFVSAKIGITA